MSLVQDAAAARTAVDALEQARSPVPERFRATGASGAPGRTAP